MPTDKVRTKYVSVGAEFVNALPHGLYLRDRRCKKILQIDFPDTDLDPSVAFLEKHVFELDGATGTFRGVLKRDPATGRVYLWLQSVVNLQSARYLPELDKNGPIHLPEPPMPKWPPVE